VGIRDFLQSGTGTQRSIHAEVDYSAPCISSFNDRFLVIIKSPIRMQSCQPPSRVFLLHKLKDPSSWNLIQLDLPSVLPFLKWEVDHVFITHLI